MSGGVRAAFDKLTAAVTAEKEKVKQEEELRKKKEFIQRSVLREQEILQQAEERSKLDREKFVKAVIRRRLMDVAYSGMRRAFSVWATATEMVVETEKEQEMLDLSQSLEEDGNNKRLRTFVRLRLATMRREHLVSAWVTWNRAVTVVQRAAAEASRVEELAAKEKEFEERVKEREEKERGDQEKFVKAVIRRRLMDVAYSGMRRAFSVWATATEMVIETEKEQEMLDLSQSLEEDGNNKRLRTFVRLRLATMKREHLSAAWARWSRNIASTKQALADAATELKNKEKFVRTVMRARLQEVAYGCLARAFSTWATATDMLVDAEKEQELRDLSQSMEMLEEESNGKRIRTFLRLRLLALKRQSLAAAMGTWTKFVVGARLAAVDSLRSELERITAQNELLAANLGDAQKEKMEAAMRNMKRKMREWMSGCLSAGFQGWVAFVKKEKEDRAKVARFQAKTRASSAGRLFAAWRSWSAESRRSELLVRRLRAKLQSGGLVRALLGWASWAREEKATRAKLAKFALRFKNNLLFGAWAGWQDYVAARLRLRSLALRTMNRLVNGKVVSAWRLWAGAVEWSKERERGEKERQGREAEAERRRQKGLAAIQRMVSGCLASTLLAWKRFTVQSVKERALLARFGKRLMMRAVSSCLLTWKDMVKDKKWLRGLMARMLGGKSKRQLFSALRVWTKYTLHQRELALEHGMTDLQELVENLHQKCGKLEAENVLLESELGTERKMKMEIAQRSMMKFVQSWRNKTVVRCWEAWKGEVVERKREAAIVGKVRKRMLNGLAAAALGSWKEFVGDRKRMRELGGRVLGRLIHKELTGGWQTWLRWIQMARGAEEAERRRKTGLGMIQRMVNASLASALVCWKQFVKKSKHERMIVER
jgi:hypothetical protein